MIEIPENERRWLDNPKNVDKIVYALYASCALLLVADFFYVKHAHFPFEEWSGFYGVFGFCGSVFLVLVAKGMRVYLKRNEDYYDHD